MIETIVFLICLLGYLCLPPLFEDAPASPSPTITEAAPIGLAIVTALILSLLLVAASLAFSAAPAAPAAPAEESGSSPILSSFGFAAGACDEMARRDIPLHTHYDRDSTLALRIPSPTGRCEGATRRATTYERTATLATGGPTRAHRCAGSPSAHTPFWTRIHTPPTVMVTAEYDVYGFDAEGRLVVVGKIVLPELMPPFPVGRVAH